MERAPALELPASVVATMDVALALQGVAAVLVVVPSQTVRENARLLAPHLAKGTPVLHATKGLESRSGRRVSEMLLEEVPELARRAICALSGPNLAPEIQRGLPAATVIAGHDAAVVDALQRLVHTTVFRVYASSDLVGVELAGSLKNVIAIAAGIADGLAMGDNAKAGIITRGLAEMTRVAVAAGASPNTFLGLAGVGDVMATCYSRLSRNRTLGEAIGRGRSVEEALAASTGVVEGVEATTAACMLAERYGIEMPIARGLREILVEGARPQAVIARLLEREPKREG